MSFFDKMKSKAEQPAAMNNPAQRGARSVDVIFPDIPETFEAFCALPQAQMQTPFDTAAAAIAALCVYPADKALSLKMLDYLRGPRPLSVMDQQFLADRFRGKDYVPRSYFKGAVPQNDYMPAAPFTITVFENPYSYQENNYANLYVRSGGADSPRSVKLRLAKDGKWYLWEQFLLSDIRQPESTNPWA